MSGRHEYPESGFLGAASAPFPGPMPHYPRNSPQGTYPWGSAAHTYTPPDITTNLHEPFGTQNRAPTLYGYGNEANAQPHSRGMLSRILKRILSDRMRSDNSEIVGFNKESCGPNRVRVTVTFETSDGL